MTQQQETAVCWVGGVGAPDGLGAAVARRHAAGGQQVVVTGRQPSRLAVVVDAITAAGGRALALAGDLADADEVARLAAGVAALGPLRAAVFNAAALVRGPALTIEPAAFEAAWRSGTYAGFLFGQAALRLLLQAGLDRQTGQCGSLVHTGATASLRGGARFAPFAAAKAGLRAVAQSFAREFGPQGVHVAHTVVDGVIDSGRLRAAMPEPAPGLDGRLQAEAIAEAYWQLHRQHRSAWTLELDLRPYREPF